MWLLSLWCLIDHFTKCSYINRAGLHQQGTGGQKQAQLTYWFWYEYNATKPFCLNSDLVVPKALCKGQPCYDKINCTFREAFTQSQGLLWPGPCPPWVPALPVLPLEGLHTAFLQATWTGPEEGLALLFPYVFECGLEQISLYPHEKNLSTVKLLFSH